MKKRLLSLLLCLSFVLALVPTVAMAVDAETDPLQPADLYYTLDGEKTSGEKPDITLSKTAVDNGDGTYTITLTAEAKEKVETKPAEVVFLLDTSGSMNWCADKQKNKWCDVNEGDGVVYCTRVRRHETNSRLTEAKNAIKTVVANLQQDNTTAKYVYFGGHKEGREWVYDAKTVVNYDGITAGLGGTPLSKGTEEALGQFTDGDHSKVLIIVADGASDDDYPTQKLKKFKDDGGIVYTVGFAFSSKNFEALASEDCHYTADDADALKVAMDEITTKVAGLISDPMGDGVELIPGTITAAGDGYNENNSEFWTSDDGKTLFWTSKDGLGNKVTLTYNVKITDEAIEAAKDNGADIPLNKNATLNYALDGKPIQLPFPVPVAHLDREIREYTLFYRSNGGTEYPDETYKEGTIVPIDKVPTREGYIFKGWYEDDDLLNEVSKVTMDHDKTVYAKWAKEYTLTYESNGGTEYQPEKYEDGTEVPMSKIPKKDGYSFTGWYADRGLTQNVTKVTMDSDKTVYANWKKDETPVLEKGDHSAYIVGCDDGLVCPERNITRAEVAAIFYRLLTDDARETYYSDTNPYSDVNSNNWFNAHVSTLTNMKILYGYEDGKFHPNEPVTRAELAAIAARFSDGPADDYADFTDVPKNHWASKSIAKAARLGWVSGDGNGKFRPGDNITRAEVMSLVNRVLERGVDKEGICEGTIQWPDNMDTGAWYYYAVQEATNSHEYARTDRPIEGQSFCYEEWTQLKQNREW